MRDGLGLMQNHARAARKIWHMNYWWASINLSRRAAQADPLCGCGIIHWKDVIMNTAGRWAIAVFWAVMLATTENCHRQTPVGGKALTERNKAIVHRWMEEGFNKQRLLTVLAIISSAALAQTNEQNRPPIIDVHMHVYAKDERWTHKTPNPITG